MEMELKVGDVVALPAGAVVLVARSMLMTLEAETDCVIEGIRSFEAGSEDDHFTPGQVIDLRPLVAGGYNESKPLYTVAISGDFAEQYIQRNLTPKGHFRKEYVKE